MQPKNKEQLSALKAIAKAFEIDYSVQYLSEREKSINLYGKDFVEKIEKAQQAVKNGDFVKLDPNKSLWENIL